MATEGSPAVQRDCPRSNIVPFQGQTVRWPQMQGSQRTITWCPTGPPSHQQHSRVARCWHNAEASLLYSPANGQSRTKATLGLKSPVTEVPSLPNCIWRWRPLSHYRSRMQHSNDHINYTLSQSTNTRFSIARLYCLSVITLPVFWQENSRISQSLALFLWRHTVRDRATQIWRGKKMCQNIGSILVLKKQ